MLRSKSGFTLVELLIVIVIIAILAAITFVAYNGIQDRAEASRASAAVESYVKLLKMYKEEHGDYPTTDTEQYGEACLGNPSDFPEQSNIAAGLCLQGNDYPDPFTIKVSPTLNSALAQYGTASSTALRAYNVYGEIWRGIRYSYTVVSTATPTPIIEWAIKPGNSCAPFHGIAQYDDGCAFAFCDVPNPSPSWCPNYGV